MDEKNSFPTTSTTSMEIQARRSLLLKYTNFPQFFRMQILFGKEFYVLLWRNNRIY
jgi:hypothetical protein